MRASVLAFVAIASGLLAIDAAKAAPLPEWLEVARGGGSASPYAEAALRTLSERRDEWLDAGYGFVELAWRTEITIERDRWVRLRRTTVRGFVQDVGAQQGGNFEISVQVSRARLLIRRAYLLRPGESPEEVDLQSIQITDSQQPYLFSDQKIVTIPLGGVVPGSIGVIEYEEIRDLDAEPLAWGLFVYLKTAVPIASQEITIVNERDPSWLEWKTNDPDLRCESTDPHRINCTRPFVDALAPDPAVRSYDDLIPHLIIAERIEWNALAERVGRLVEDKVDTSPGIRAEVERIRKKFGDDTSRAEELYRVVSNQVRYLGFEHGDSAVIPHRASETWARRYGDCKDKVTLFVAMADALDIEARPVLTSSVHFDVGNILLPAMAYFDHMIVCSRALARVDDGCVDVTLASAPAALPYPLQGAIALDLGHASQRWSPRIRALPRREILWEVGIDRSVTLDCDGVARETVSRSNGGSWGDMLRTGLASISPAERAQHTNEEFAAAFPSVTDRPKMKFTGLADSSRPWSIAYSIDRAGAFQAKGRESHFDFDNWLAFHLRSMVIENENHAYDLPGLEVVSNARYAVCERARVEALGPALRFKADWGEVQREYELIPGGFLVKTHVRMPSRRVTPEGAAQMRLSIGRILEQSAIRFDYAVE